MGDFQLFELLDIKDISNQNPLVSKWIEIVSSTNIRNQLFELLVQAEKYILILFSFQISNFKELSDADYFSKNIEFATWLKDSKDTFFSDLTSESARKLFAEFVKKWNKKKLDSKYYDGILTAPRSSHNWKIKAEPKADPQRYGEYDQV